MFIDATIISLLILMRIDSNMKFKLLWEADKTTNLTMLSFPSFVDHG